MKKLPLISVIIPVYNAEKYIEETLLSVLNQTYKNWECIVVNDGSTDNTPNIIDEWIKKDERFRIFHKTNEGLSITRNFGITRANADYVAFLDSDDIWMPHHLSSLVKVIQDHKVDMVFSFAYGLLSDNSHTTSPIMGEADNEKIIGIQSGKECIENFLRSNKISPSFVLCNKHSLIKLENFSYFRKAEDYHTWIKMLCNRCVFYGLDLATGYYRIVNNSMSNADRNCTREITEIISLFKKQIKEYDIDYEYFFNLWARRYFLLKDTKKHYIEAIKYIESLEEKNFKLLKRIAPLLPRKILKLLVLQILK